MEGSKFQGYLFSQFDVSVSVIKFCLGLGNMRFLIFLKIKATPTLCAHWMGPLVRPLGRAREKMREREKEIGIKSIDEDQTRYLFTTKHKIILATRYE